MTVEPVAIVVRGEANGLGVVRSLGEAGVPTIVVDTTRKHAAMWSRWVQDVVVVDQLYGRPFVDRLLLLQREIGGKPVLILTDEMAVNTVSEHRDELSPFFLFEMPPADMVTVLGNKARFQEFAERHDLPVPRTAMLRSSADLPVLARFQYPIIVKPADKRPVYLGATERLSQIFSSEEAHAVCRRMFTTAGEVVAQEWIEGSDQNIYFALFHAHRDPKAVSNAASVFFGRKLQCHPPRVGTTAVCVAAPEVADALTPVVLKFLDDSRYEGLGSLEFKWDELVHRFVIIEPTVGRTDWQEEIATLNGVNLPLVAYRSALGLPALPQRAGDAAAWRESIRFWRPHAAMEKRIRIYDCYWRMNDPLPAAAYYFNFAFSYLTRGIMNCTKGRTRAAFGKIEPAA